MTELEIVRRATRQVLIHRYNLCMPGRFVLRLAKPDGVPAILAAIEPALRGLNVNDYSPSQIENVSYFHSLPSVEV